MSVTGTMNKDDVTSSNISATLVVWVFWLVLVIVSSVPVFYRWVFGVAANGKNIDTVAVPIFVAVLSAVLLIFKQTAWGLGFAIMLVPSTVIAVYFLY